MTKEKEIDSFFVREYKNDKRLAVMARVKITQPTGAPHKMTFEVASSTNPSHARMITEALNKSKDCKDTKLVQYLF